jgi:Bacterial regulatory proteins, luxR family
MLSPTPTQLRALEAFLITGSQKGAAEYMGISIQTVKNHLGALYQRLGVSGAIAAATHLGYINIPDSKNGPKICGWVAYCSRPFSHRGYHGDMRSLEVENANR